MPTSPLDSWFRSYCGDSIWDSQLAWNTSEPRLTRCFRKTVLVWAPPIYLILFAPLLIRSLWIPRDRPRIRWNAYNIIRLVIAAALLINLVVDVAITVNGYHGDAGEPDHRHWFPADVANAFIRLTFAILLAVLFWAMPKRGLHTSGVIWFYLGLSAISLTVELISVWYDRNFPKPGSSMAPADMTLLINGLLTWALFAQSFISDPGSPSDQYYYKDMKQPNKDGSLPQQQKPKPYPKIRASFFSRLTYDWYSSLTYIGWKRPIVLDDVWTIRTEDTSLHNYGLFKKQLDKCMARHSNTKTTKPFRVNILKILWGTIRFYFLGGAILKLIQDILIFVSPMVMKKLINFIGDRTEETWHGYVYASGLFFVTLGQIFSLNYYFHRMMMVGLRVRTQLIAAIYRKALQLSNSSRSKFTTGQIVNLMAVDAQRFVDISSFINLIWSAPFQIVMALWLLWQELGISVLGGFFFMIILIPINSYLTSIFRRLQVKQMKLKDERVKAMNEILNGMKIIKLYSWERAFIDKIQRIRSRELAVLRKMNYLTSIIQALYVVAPFLVSFITFGLYVIIDDSHVLTASKAFVSLSLFNILRFPLVMLPNLITLIVMASVSVKRLNNFLSSTELTNYIVRREDNANEEHCMTLDNCSFSWFNRYDIDNEAEGQDKKTKKKNNKNGKTKPMDNDINGRPEKNDQWKPFLRDIDMRIKKNSLVAIVGNVGSGKSSLLNAILGNMELTNGTINISKSMRIAYTPQEAWIQNNTLRGNIVFDLPFHEDLYREVIHATALMSDFNVLPGGDLTEIGEKGINLSGGQKQRVSLARACYSDADIYLLDDPLSAVDSHVGQHIFDHMLSSETGLLRHKTRILVTNNLSVLPSTDYVYVLKDGKIIERGTYQQLMKQNNYLANLVHQYSSNKDQDEENGAKDDEKLSATKAGATTGNTETSSPKVAFDFKINKLVEKEEAQTGQVKFQVYQRYLKAISAIWCTAIIINYVLYQIASSGTGLWLSEWSKHSEQSNKEYKNINNITTTTTKTTATNDDDDDGHSRTIFYLLIYGLIGISQAIFYAVGWVSLTKGILCAAKNLHNTMLDTIFRSAMAFFDVTPLGRILNRFSKDIDVCDTTIQMNVRVTLTCFLSTAATLIIISCMLPVFLILILPITICFYFIQRLYISTARQLKRIESITKSPVYSHFSETLSGVTTIRAYGVQNNFIEKNDEKADINNGCNVANIVSIRWLSVRLETVANLVVFFSAIFSVVYRNTMDSAAVGLIITYALSITQNLSWLVRSLTDIETNIVGVERILEYTDLSTEAAWEIPEAAPPAGWPHDGRIEFVNYSTRYRDGLDLVLRGISAVIEPCEKIGIVGRTGAGKSSLTLALFRLIEPAGGCIKIDGIDISKLGLHQLRKRLTIIPQDPVLFSGTLRENLDPFCNFTDEEIWRCLEHAHLKEFATTKPDQLSHEIAEGGSNLSVGQRQLVCLARALLRKTKILVLDEATAAVDMETDSLIQRTIRQSFSDCTILTIAHRLNTIMDSDRILVLNQGRVAEFDAPGKLLANQDTIFYSMAEAAGLVEKNSSHNDDGIRL